LRLAAAKFAKFTPQRACTQGALEFGRWIAGRGGCGGACCSSA